MTKASIANLALFLSGLFAGGVLDHGLLALQGSEVTSYQIHVGVMGTWGFEVRTLPAPRVKAQQLPDKLTHRAVTPAVRGSRAPPARYTPALVGFPRHSSVYAFDDQ